MKQAILITLSLFICSCHSSPPKSASTTPETRTDGETEEPQVAWYPAPGIIVGEGVRIRQDSTLQSPVVDKVSTGEMLTILEVSEKKYTLVAGDSCEMYPMVQVKTKAGKTGWVFGKFVFEVLKYGDEKTPDVSPFSFDGRTFDLIIGRGFAIGPWDFDEGNLSGCDGFDLALLFDTKTGETFLVSLPEPKNFIPDFKYWCLEDDEGGKETVTATAINAQQQLVVSICAGYMEGYGNYQIIIDKQNGKYAGRCSNYQQFEEGDCPDGKK